jgi:hypothetical protein
MARKPAGAGKDRRPVTIMHVSEPRFGEFRGWVAFQGDHRYPLSGDPAGRFWWSAGLCRFEPGELDGYGVERV